MHFFMVIFKKMCIWSNHHTMLLKGRMDRKPSEGKRPHTKIKGEKDKEEARKPIN